MVVSGVMAFVAASVYGHHVDYDRFTCESDIRKVQNYEVTPLYCVRLMYGASALAIVVLVIDGLLIYLNVHHGYQTISN